MNYGIPYKGSKSRLCKFIIKLLPKDKPLRDVFGGGGAVSLCALDSGYFDRIYYNELDNDIFNLFFDLCKGNLNLSKIKSNFITREEFFLIKNKENKTSLDLVYLLCYSFGNNQKDYMFGKKIEEWKYLLHKLHFKQGINNQQDLNSTLNQLSESRIFKGGYKVYFKIDYNDYKNIDNFRLKIRYFINKRILDGKEIGEDYLRSIINKKKDKTTLKYCYNQNLRRLESLESLQRLQSLERLQRLESLQRQESLERLKILNKDYKDLNVPIGDVIYCDPPYENTSGYNELSFNIDEFWERAEEKSKTNPIYISSYQGRPGRKIINTGKKSIMNKNISDDKTEKIFYK